MLLQGYSLKKTRGFGKHPNENFEHAIKHSATSQHQVNNLDNRVNILEKTLTIVATQKKPVGALLEDQERSSI